MSKRVMISQPMRDKTESEIFSVREDAIKYLKELGYEVVDTYIKEDWENQNTDNSRNVRCIPLKFLSESINLMSLCDIVYFCKGWEYARGCKIEHECAVEYGLQIMYEV
jgi:hypothetical protein